MSAKGSPAQLKDKPAGAPDYGSWRSMAVGTMQGRKSFLDKDTPMQETIDGLLGLMPIGCRNVTYIPEGAMAELAKGETADADIGKLPGVQSWAHGPYLDDWSKVPAEIATKYNTSPSFGK